MPGGKWDKFKNFIGFTEEYVEESGRTQTPMPRENTPRKTSSIKKERPRERTVTPASVGSRRRSEERVMKIDRPGGDAMSMVVFQPQTYEDTQTIIDNLKLRKSVIVNLESMDVETGQRVLDFVSGAIYSLDGSIRKVSKGIFLLAPSGIDISGNLPFSIPKGIGSRRY